MRTARRRIGRIIDISAYASSHPHEDWAETFAHYLHMVDTLETAYAFGLRIKPKAGQDDNLKASITFDPYTQTDFDTIIEAWIPMTFAVNSINRIRVRPEKCEADFRTHSKEITQQAQRQVASARERGSQVARAQAKMTAAMAAAAVSTSPKPPTR